MTNLARLQPKPPPTEVDLCAEMIALSQRFFLRADVLEQAFIRSTDKHAIQRGAYCAEAVSYRYIASQLRELARSID